MLVDDVSTLPGMLSPDPNIFIFTLVNCEYVVCFSSSKNAVLSVNPFRTHILFLIDFSSS